MFLLLINDDQFQIFILSTGCIPVVYKVYSTCTPFCFFLFKKLMYFSGKPEYFSKFHLMSLLGQYLSILTTLILMKLCTLVSLIFNFMNVQGEAQWVLWSRPLEAKTAIDNLHQKISTHSWLFFILKKQLHKIVSIQ